MLHLHQVNFNKQQNFFNNLIKVKIMGKTVVKPWVKVAGVMIAVAAIVFGLFTLGQKNGVKGVDLGSLFIDDGTDNKKHPRNQNKAFSAESDSRKFSPCKASERNTCKSDHTSRNFSEIQLIVGIDEMSQNNSKKD